jgi:hypothetical protein
MAFYEAAMLDQQTLTLARSRWRGWRVRCCVDVIVEGQLAPESGRRRRGIRMAVSAPARR